MITVTLCKKKKNAEKEYLFLNYSPAIFNTVTKRTYRQEYLRLFLYINPKTPQQRSHNKEAWRMGQIKRDIRAAEAMRGVHFTGTNLYSTTHARLNTMKPNVSLIRNLKICLNIFQR